MFQPILILMFSQTLFALSWVCDYPCTGTVVNRCRRKGNVQPCVEGPGSTSFLYKEDNVAEVKWLEKYEYCRAKGDPSVYQDAGQGKCEYSRDICVWNSDNNSCELNPNRGNDPISECQDLLLDNALVEGLDNGRT